MFPLFIKFLHKKLLMLLLVTRITVSSWADNTHICHYWTLSTYILCYMNLLFSRLQLTRPARCGLSGCAWSTCSVSCGSDGVRSRYR